MKHIKSLSYPSTNGAAERFIRTLKRALKGGDDLHMDLTTFLMSYRISPHATTSTPSCELFLKRTIRTRLDMIRPDLGSTISDKRSAQKAYHDVHSRVRDFFLGQRVLAHNFREGPRWISGVIAEKRGPLTYLVQMRDDVLWKRHFDQIINATDQMMFLPVPILQILQMLLLLFKFLRNPHLHQYFLLQAQVSSNLPPLLSKLRYKKSPCLRNQNPLLNLVCQFNLILRHRLVDILCVKIDSLRSVLVSQCNLCEGGRRTIVFKGGIPKQQDYEYFGFYC